MRKEKGVRTVIRTPPKFTERFHALMIERYVDFIQVSIYKPERECAEMDSIPPVQFYSRGYRDGAGVRYYYGNHNTKVKKALAVASGIALDALHNQGLSDEYITGMFLEQSGSFSRIDLAVTEYVEDNLITIGEVQKWYQQDLIVSYLTADGMAKSISSIQLDRIIPETLYIGDPKKRGKKGIFRAYDKGVDLELPEDLITRLELELRAKKAHAIAENIAYRNDFSGSFRKHFNVYADNFDRLMDAPITEPIKRKRGIAKDKDIEMDKRWRWLMEQVAPAVRDAVEYDLKTGKGSERANYFATKAGIKEWKYRVNLNDFSDWD